MAVLDTHLLSHQIFSSLDVKPESFTLSGILTYLQCPYAPREMHNAGNDATFTLHALLRLALKYADSHYGISEKAAQNRETLQLFVDREINYGRRWEPVRSALGAIRSARLVHARVQDGSTTAPKFVPELEPRSHLGYECISMKMLYWSPA
jgi:hypothetical protein